MPSAFDPATCVPGDLASGDLELDFGTIPHRGRDGRPALFVPHRAELRHSRQMECDLSDEVSSGAAVGPRSATQGLLASLHF